MNKNRGMLLEVLINKAIMHYKKDNICIFHKKDLPISFKSIARDQGKLTIQNGYIKTKSTTDYYGIYKGVFITFEAKSTLLDKLPKSNIEDHQLRYLEIIKEHGGLSFLLIGFNSYNKYFFLSIETYSQNDEKSISIEFCEKYGYTIDLIYPGMLDFISAIRHLI